MSDLFAELRRRNIFRVAGVYAVTGWILMQVVSVMTPALSLPDWVDSFFAVVLIIGFPIAMLLAWAFEMTPEGMKRTENVSGNESITTKTGRKLDFAILGGLVLVGTLIIGGWFLPQKFAAPETIVQMDEKPSIAVMPFEDFSAAKDQEYFANGISEELLNVLARIEGLKVSSRTSSFAFKEREASTGEIAEALGVKHLLEGSIRKSGTTLRITAQLIDTANDEHMWSETYDRPLTAENLFAVQDEIAAAIVAELKGKLSLTQTIKIPAKQAPRTQSLQAYELYLRARQQMNKRKPDTLRAAIEGYQQVTALDPEFAPGYSGLAETYLLMAQYTDMQTDEGVHLAKPNVEKAMELAPNSAESLTTAAMFAVVETQFDQALTLTNRAIAANPNYADAYLRKGRALLYLGKPEEALIAIQKARSLDPLSAIILNNLAWMQSQIGDREAAKQTARDNIRWNPKSPFGYQFLAALSYQDGEVTAAHSLYKDALALNLENAGVQNALANIYMDVGLYNEVSSVTSQLADRATALWMSGQKRQSLKLIRDNLQTDNLVSWRLAYVLYLSGDVKGAYPHLRQLVTDFNILERAVRSDTADFIANLAFVLQKNGDGDADILISKLETYLGEDKTALDKSLRIELRAGIVLQLLRGDEEAVFVWLDRFLDLGFSDTVLLTTPPFKALRGTPEFEKRVARMAQNAAKHRAEIEEQLANPKPNWIKNE